MPENITCSLNFDLFKSNVCHELKRYNNDVLFIVNVLENATIPNYWNNKHYLEALYYYSMIDYLRRINNLDFEMPYKELKNIKLTKTIVPAETIMCDKLDKSYNYPTVKSCIKASIPEFIKHNIAENGVRNAV